QNSRGHGDRATKFHTPLRHPKWGKAVRKKIAAGHPVRHILVFRHVTDNGQIAVTEFLGRNAEDFAISTSGSENIHEQFKCGCLTRPVGAHKTIDRTFRDLEVQPIQGLDTAESLRQLLGFYGVTHTLVRSSSFEKET